MAHIFGLHEVGREKRSIPLQNVSVKVNMLDFLAEITVQQRYTNDGSDPIEAVYTFPLEADAVLKAFTYTIDGKKTVVGQVKETEAAKDDYDDALASGHGAALLMQDESMLDVFTMRVGNLPPGSSVTLSLTYATQVPESPSPSDNPTTPPSSLLRLLIPTAVAPRYNPTHKQARVSAVGSGEGMPGEGVSKEEGDLLNITGSVRTSSRILSLRAPGFDGLQTQLLDQTATFTLSANELAKDLVLTVEVEGLLADRAWLDSAGALCVSACLRPGQLANVTNESVGEYIFLVDRSGSMGGSKIRQAQEALTLCVSALPAGAKFNIIGFGSQFRGLWEQSTTFDEASRDEALRHCEGLCADLGGTEILEPLKAIADTPALPNFPRQVFVLTDGEVSNTKAVIEQVKHDAIKAGTRYFALGIGSGASSALVKGIASAGNGTVEMVVDGERMHGKVMAQMECALDPFLSNVRIALPAGLTLSHPMTPRHPPPLFRNIRRLFFGLVDTATLPTEDVSLEVRVEASGPDGDVSLPVALNRGTGEHASTVQSLATKATLNDLEGEGKRDEAIALSVASNVSCKFTSWVAVEERQDPVTGTLTPVHIPLRIVKEPVGAGPMVFGGAPGGIRLSSRKRSSPPMSSMPTFMSAPSPMSFASPVSLCASSAPMRAMMPTQQCQQLRTSFSMPREQMRVAATSFGDMPRQPMRGEVSHLGGFGGMGRQEMRRDGKRGPFGAPPPPPAPTRRMLGVPRRSGSRGVEDECEAEVGSGFARGGGGEGMGSGGDGHVEIVKRQTVDGSWALDDWLVGLVGKTREQITAVQVGSDAVWATALVLAVLATRFAGFEGEWGMGARKAKRWLEKQCSQDMGSKHILDSAQAFLQT